MEPLLEFKEVNLKLGGKQLLENINWTIEKTQNWAIVGPSGSGKTCLAASIAGKIFHQGQITRHFEGSVGYIPQQHHFQNKAHVNNFYYQQRFQSQDAEDAATVREPLEETLSASPDYYQKLIRQFHLEHLMHKPLLQLSNGENKRLQLCKSLLKNPSLLLLDHPFIGLDKEGRKELHHFLNGLMQSGLPVIIITSPSEIPDGITHVLELKEGKIVFLGEKDSWAQRPQKKEERYQIDHSLLSELGKRHDPTYESMVEFRTVSIRYNETQILDEIDWKVEQGSCWCLSGANGAGKSTLLSLITADNPQAYANNIHLFGKKKGSGESIWQLKQKMGYVSPELHLYFPQSCSCFDVIASGLFDTIGLFRTLSTEQYEKVASWVKLLKLDEIAFKGLHQVSLSQQRMAMLGRALVKNPPLLILDEPCQGLDDEQTSFINSIVNQLCFDTGTTLVYVSHYQLQLPTCIKQVLHLEDGRGKISSFLPE
jgi:molybdate transport system ATP-binding protein